MLAVGFPMGKIFMSISSIGLAAAWLLEGKYSEKWEISKERFHAPLILSGIYFLHVLWLINTSDFSYAKHDLLLKLPLLSFPIVIGTIRISRINFKRIVLVFFIGVVLSTLISFGIYIEVFPTQRDLGDIRNISIFMSHIRLSLLICMAIVIGVYYGVKDNYGWVLLLFSGWLVYFLVLLSGTGLVILVFLSIYGSFNLAKKSSLIQVKRIFQLVVVLLIIGVPAYVFVRYQAFYNVNDTANLANLDEFTPDGEKYIHDVDDLRTENGFYTWIYIAPNECEKYWNEKSLIKFDSLDALGQPIKYTLYRYLTSRGLRKDKNGILALEKEDIEKIESGHSTCEEKNPIDTRLNQIFFEFRELKYNSGYNGHSVVQRFLFAYTGFQIFLENKFTGVGTGDVPNAFKDKYIEMNSPLDDEHRLRSHNQFLTFLISFGMVGFFLFLFLWLYPIVKFSRNNYLLVAFLLIIILSFLSDNTLERQAGVTFFSFFTSLFLFHFPKIEQRN